MEPLEIQQPKGRRLTRTRPGSKNATASVAPTRRGTRASTATVEDTSTAELYPSMPNASDNEHEFVAEKSTEAIPTEETVDPSSKTKGTKAKGSRKASARKPNRKQDIAPPEESTVAVDEKMERQDVVEEKPQQTRNRQTSRQLPTRNTRASVTSVTHDVMDLASAVNSSVLETRTAQDNSGHESDASVVKHGRAKRGSRKASTAVKTAKGGRKASQLAATSKISCNQFQIRGVLRRLNISQMSWLSTMKPSTLSLRSKKSKRRRNNPRQRKRPQKPLRLRNPHRNPRPQHEKPLRLCHTMNWLALLKTRLYHNYHQPARL